MSTFHEFQADKGLVNFLIHNQNGTIETSLIELICNSIDAGSKEIVVTVTETGFSIKDSGRGFKDEDEIMMFFKRFGTPHKEGDAVFGRFRIGRGQIISFSNAVWHSKEFKMKTCFKNGHYGFDFIKDKTDIYNGCHVFGDFNDEIKHYAVKQICIQIEQMLKYAKATIILNNIPISISENDVDWSYEDEDLKILWEPYREDGIKLYSQGVYVKNINSHLFDLNADIVTKKALKLNMARNETHDSDPIWAKISAILIKRAQLSTIGQKNKKTNEKERRGLINQFLEGILSYHDASRLNLLKDCRGHTFSINSLLTRHKPFCIAVESCERRAEWLATGGFATVLHCEEARIWRVASSKEWIDKIVGTLKDCATPRLSNEPYSITSQRLAKESLLLIKAEDFNKLVTNINQDMLIIKSEELSIRHLMAKKAIQVASNTMALRLSYVLEKKVEPRKIIIGQSVIADGWTDGESYIAITKKMLKNIDIDYYGAVQIVSLLMHEYIHDASSYESHIHDFDFYKKYHDLASESSSKGDVVGHTATILMNNYSKFLSDKLEKLPKSVYKTFSNPIVDRTEEVTIFLGKNGLSKFGTLLLDLLPFKIKKTKSKIVVVKVRCSYDDSCSRLILNMVAKAGYKFKELSELMMEFDDYKEAFRLISEDKKATVKKWLIDNDHDANIVKIIWRGNNNYTKTWLDILTEDVNSDVLYYETSELSQIKVSGSKNHQFDFKVGSVGSFYSRFGIGAPCDFAQDKIARFKVIKKSMDYLITGLKSEKERDEFKKYYSQ